TKAQGMWLDPKAQPRFTQVVELDLSTVEPSLAGPKRPQDRIALSAMKTQWRYDLENTFGKPAATADSTGNRMEAEGGMLETEAEVAVATDVADPGYDGIDVHYHGEKFK